MSVRLRGVVGGPGSGDYRDMAPEMDEHTRSDYEILNATSQTELSVRDTLRQIEPLAPSTWTDYDGTAAVINDYVNLYSGGQEVDRPEWKRALKETGAARQKFAQAACDAIGRQVDEASTHLAGERADLDQALHALEDVQSAIHDAEEARKLSSVVFKLKELAEFAEKPSIKGAIGIIRNKESHEEEIVHQGIENLGQYGVDLELANHGFSSVQELDQRVANAYRNVAEAAAQMEHFEHQQALAEEWKDYQMPENWLVDG